MAGVAILFTVAGPLYGRDTQKPQTFHATVQVEPDDGSGVRYINLMPDSGKPATISGPSEAPLVVWLVGADGRRVTLVGVVQEP